MFKIQPIASYVFIFKRRYSIFKKDTLFWKLIRLLFNTLQRDMSIYQADVKTRDTQEYNVSNIPDIENETP